MRTIYVVRTHKYDDDTVAMVHGLAGDVGPENVIVVYDDSKNPLPGDDGRPATKTVLREPEPLVTLTYSSADAIEFNRYHVSMWHNGHEPFMFLDQVLAFDYDYIFMLEYDVRCLGSWREAMKHLEDIDTDYLSNYMGDSKKYPDLLWDSFVGDDSKIPPMHERRVGLFAISRCSRRLVKALAQNNGVYDAYCEIYVPTLARQLSMTVAEFPGEILGVFAPAVFKDINGWKEYVASREKDDRLYHAIKN